MQAWLITGCTQIDLRKPKIVNPNHTYKELLDRAVSRKKSKGLKEKPKKKYVDSDTEDATIKKEVKKELKKMGICGNPGFNEK